MFNLYTSYCKLECSFKHLVSKIVRHALLKITGLNELLQVILSTTGWQRS